MLAIRLIGALLVICGVVYMARAAIRRGSLSDAHADPEDTPAHTLEPRPRRRFGFLGVKANWPGLVMITIGGLMLLAPFLPFWE